MEKDESNHKTKMGSKKGGKETNVSEIGLEG
jgi:hypothetical protein